MRVTKLSKRLRSISWRRGSPRSSTCPQYDTKGRVVKVNLVSNSAAYEIESDFEVHAVMSKKDGKSINNPCVVDGSTVYAVISKQMTVFEGRQMVAISITNNSDVELKAFPFVLNVIRAPSDAESYASEDEPPCV